MSFVRVFRALRAAAVVLLAVVAGALAFTPASRLLLWPCLEGAAVTVVVAGQAVARERARQVATTPDAHGAASPPRSSLTGSEAQCADQRRRHRFLGDGAW